jgi:mRNA-degrading endonuclease RelE of RelBE toxin-antitoxin system
LKRWSIAVSATAQGGLRNPYPEIKRSIRKALDDLAKDPYAGKPLKEELAGLWSLPVSHHRVIYQMEKGKITVVFIGPRRDVYERLRELLAEK